MFRAASKLSTLQRVGGGRSRSSSSSSRYQHAAVSVEWSGLVFSGRSSDNDDRTSNATNHNATLLRSFHTQMNSSSAWQMTKGATLSTNNASRRMWMTGGASTMTSSTVTTRGFASNASGNDNNNAGSDDASSVDDTLEKLFRENEAMKGDATAEPWVDGVNSVVNSGGLDFVPTWYNPADQSINLIWKFHEVVGCELGWAIVGTTLLIRVALFPVVVSGQKSSSRMAHLQPEMAHLRKKFEAIPNPTTEQKAQLGNKIRDLFAKYDVKPLRAMVAPFMQFPFFMGMFFGMKKMPDYFPQEMREGGMLWFPDLTVTDPNYILPGICFLTFLATVELGKEQMMAGNPQNAPMMINVFRGLSVMMIPICINFHAGMLCYWTVSNLFTLIQIGVMKLPSFKKAVGIWEPPKPVPGIHTKDEGLVKAAQKLMDEFQGKPTSVAAKLKQHNEKIENKKKVSELSKNSRDRRRRSIKQKRRS